MLKFNIAGFFNSIPSLRLIQHLRHKGIPEPIVRWIANFLTAHQTRYRIDGQLSNAK